MINIFSSIGNAKEFSRVTQSKTPRNPDVWVGSSLRSSYESCLGLPNPVITGELMIKFYLDAGPGTTAIPLTTDDFLSGT